MSLIVYFLIRCKYNWWLLSSITITWAHFDIPGIWACVLSLFLGIPHLLLSFLVLLHVHKVKITDIETRFLWGSSTVFCFLNLLHIVSFTLLTRQHAHLALKCKVCHLTGPKTRASFHNPMCTTLVHYITPQFAKIKEFNVIAGKLKEMGNSILGRFGMSVDNFKTVKDPNTGSYSVQFQR